MSLKVKLANMVFYAYHGVLAAEKELGQRFEVDLEYGPLKISTTDDLSQGVDYAEVYKLVSEIVTGKEYNLIESLAEAIAEKMLQQFPVSQVTVRVRKPQVPLGAPLDYVEVEISKEANR